jgi:hypothetical protein
VSASSDKNVNLFTLGGHFIGNMGRADGWNLKDPSTYLNKEIHHITPNPEPPESNESPSRKRTKKNVRIESK